MENKGEITIYTSGKNKIELEVKVKDETVWLSQRQMVDLFQTTQSVISRHLKNVFESGELDQKSNMQKMHNAFSDKPVILYSLDAIISVGYRVNSKKATQFRIWATNTLKKYLVNGYAINEKRLLDQQKRRLEEIQNIVLMIKEKADYQELTGHEKELLDIISDYARSWKILDQFDHDQLNITRVNKYLKFTLTQENYESLIANIRNECRRLGGKSDLFGAEIGDKIKGIIGSISQTFDGVELYGSIEEKAANLLYFLIKDHPFSDGNKRIGSMLFLYFLERNNYLYRENGERKINDNAIIALALLIATSNPREKDNIVKLVINLIQD